MHPNIRVVIDINMDANESTDPVGINKAIKIRLAFICTAYHIISNENENQVTRYSCFSFYGNFIYKILIEGKLH
jgi:hypothetical protein